MKAKSSVQLLLVVEAKTKKDSDCIYISEVLNRFYKGKLKLIGRKDFICMNGNTNLERTKAKIDVAIKKWELGSNGITKVVCFLDVDEIDTNYTQKQLLEKNMKICKDNSYNVVLFVRDVEEVFVGERIEKSSKTSRAKQYMRSKEINKIKENKLRIINPRSKKTSDILCVLDEVFTSH